MECKLKECERCGDKVPEEELTEDAGKCLACWYREDS
tara:strand:- start:634 stop:744 length:111 start_codon:yes stop_codon:yes gene_type:complete